MVILAFLKSKKKLGHVEILLLLISNFMYKFGKIYAVVSERNCDAKNPKMVILAFLKYKTKIGPDRDVTFIAL